VAEMPRGELAKLVVLLLGYVPYRGYF